MRSILRPVLASSLAIYLVGCAAPVLVEPSPGVLTFENPLEPVDAAVEVCIPVALRKRQWNVPPRGFRVALGPRAAVNFERLVKAAFSDVTVTFDSECGARTELPWMELVIASAKRDRTGPTDDGLVHTEITLETTLRNDANEPIWQWDVTSQVAHEPGPGDGVPYLDERMPIFLFPVGAVTIGVRERAAEAFGEALDQGLRQTFDALVAAPEIRNQLEPRPENDPS